MYFCYQTARYGCCDSLSVPFSEVCFHWWPWIRHVRRVSPTHSVWPFLAVRRKSVALPLHTYFILPEMDARIGRANKTSSSADIFQTWKNRHTQVSISWPEMMAHLEWWSSNGLKATIKQANPWFDKLEKTTKWGDWEADKWPPMKILLEAQEV